jgi:UDP-N-acetylglucosamine:LPS N-acetylglucosamine transferase
MSETFAVIAGGGTAGHVNPGLPALSSSLAGTAADTIVWVGSERGSK